MRRANRREVVYPVDVYPLSLHERRRSVPAHFRVCVVLYQNAVADGPVEVTADRWHVGLIPVRAQLRATIARLDRNDQALLEVRNEGVCRLPASLADRERDQQFCFAVQRRVEVLVANLAVVEMPKNGMPF